MGKGNETMHAAKIRALAVVASALLLHSCATLADADRPLEGTSWRLVEMQSMDDSQGVTRPSNPDLYTVEFDRSGSAYVQLDCNRVLAPWTATRTGAGQGALEFGPPASTSTTCPQAPLGERLGKQLGFVRSWLMRDGRLNMSLMADGGILVWERKGSR